MPGSEFRAWTIAPGGQFYILQASGLLYEYSPDLQQQFAPSGPLFEGRDPARSFLAASGDLLIVSSASVTRTLVLERASYAKLGELPRGGQVALDGSQRLFIGTDEAVWAYDLSDLSASPAPVTKWPVDSFTPRPRNLAVDALGRQLIVTLHDISASPPHQQEWYQAYDLRSLQPTVTFPAQLGDLARPVVVDGGIVAGMSAKNGLLGSKLIVFDREGRELRAAQPFDGQPAADARGEWIYILRERGVWVLKSGDLSLVAFDPSGSNPQANLLLSPDGAKLYRVEDGAIRIQDTASLRAGGIARLGGPLLWFFNTDASEFSRPRWFPAPGAPGVAFVQVGGYGETWRSEDRGLSWAMLPGLVYPNFHYASHLSISTDFAVDGTVVAVTLGETPQYLRSTDLGDTWAPYDPPFAFVSDRDGNREIYTADRGRPGGGQALNLVRRTNNPSAEENPAWSPAWTRLAFQSNRHGNWDIYTVRADCDGASADDDKLCDERRITDDPGDDVLPAWSPDGQWIAFVSTRDGTPQMYLTPANGGAVHRLTPGAGASWRPAWWPDGQRLFFTGSGPDGSNDIQRVGHIWTVDGTFDTPEVLSFVASPADERDAAVGREYFVYLSNESGVMRTYRRYFGDSGPSFPVTPGIEAEGHPAVLDDEMGTVLVTLERDGQTGIYRATSGGYEPFVVGQEFNGQPAAGPVPWQPPADWSMERVKTWQR